MPLAGTLIAISERGLDHDGNLIAFLIGGPTPGQFSVRRTDNFDVSDAVLLPSGDLLVLERKFSWLAGVGIRIRRIALKSVAPGAVVDGPSIFDADLGHEIDNMEGIDAHVTPGGRHRADHGLRRQFLDDPAHAAAAIHAGGVIRRPRRTPIRRMKSRGLASMARVVRTPFPTTRRGYGSPAFAGTTIG